MATVAADDSSMVSMVLTHEILAVVDRAVCGPVTLKCSAGKTQTSSLCRRTPHLANLHQAEELVHFLVKTSHSYLSLCINITFGPFNFYFLIAKGSGIKLILTLSSTSSMEKSLPSPRELLHVRMELLLVTRARMVHLSMTSLRLFLSILFIFRMPQGPRG